MEFEKVGKKCSLSYCKVKDFLPFKCSKCKLDFCLEHRAESKHDCENI